MQSEFSPQSSIIRIPFLFKWFKIFLITCLVLNFGILLNIIISKRLLDNFFLFKLGLVNVDDLDCIKFRLKNSFSQSKIWFWFVVSISSKFIFSFLQEYFLKAFL